MTTSPQFSGKRILVTGGTGFLGGRIVERLVLEHGADVTVLVRNYAKAMRIARFGAVHMVSGAFTEPDVVTKAAEGCEYILHCAHNMAGTFKRHNYRTNVQGTLNVVNAAVRTGARMVHVSSVDVYGRPTCERLDERTPFSGKGNFYAEAKRRTEACIWRRYRQEPFPVSVIQPTIIYGPYAPWTLGACNQLLAGRVAIPANGEGCCNAVHVDDVVDAIFLAAIKDEAVGETFLVSGGEPPTWGDWFRRHEEILGVESLLPLTTEEFERLMAKERHKRDLLPVLKAIMSDGTALGLLKRIMRARLGEAAIKGTIKVVGDALFSFPGCGQWDMAAKRIVRRMRARGAANANNERTPILPADAWEAALYASKARVSIEKARTRLGYEPRYSFDQGMAATADFIRWAIPLLCTK